MSDNPIAVVDICAALKGEADNSNDLRSHPIPHRLELVMELLQYCDQVAREYIQDVKYVVCICVYQYYQMLSHK